MDFKLETERVVKTILKRSARRVLLQFPEGLKNHGIILAEEIQARTKATVYVSADPCYGACDLPFYEADVLDIDLIIHYGHAPYVASPSEKVVYVEGRAQISVSEIVKKAISLLQSYRNIGLVTTVQHIHKLGDAVKMLTLSGFNVKLGKAGGHVRYDGQILGCDYTCSLKIREDVDAYLYIGGGLFHPLGVMLATGKPVIAADPYLNKVTDVSDEGVVLLKKRQATMAKVVGAKELGMIVGVKTGQISLKLAEEFKKKLEKIGKKVTLLCIREITPSALDNFPNIDAFINTACPRVGVDDSMNYRKPILTLTEAQYLLEM
jgi:2-(3-amino-3-carboxypropyl)histidine synthase